MAGLPISQLKVGGTYKFVRNYNPKQDDTITMNDNYIPPAAGVTRATILAGQECQVTAVHADVNTPYFECTWQNADGRWELSTSSEILGAVGGGRRKSRKSRKSRRN